MAAANVQLNDYEKLVYNITRLGDFNVIGISIVDPKSEKQVSVDENLLRKALFYMYKRHPLFRAYLHEDKYTKRCYFHIPAESEQLSDETKFNNISMSVLDDDAHSTKLTEELEAFNMILFKYENRSLLWRVKWIKYIEYARVRYALALVMPFFITDGLNINALCLEIVNILNSLLTNSECEEMLTQLELIDNLHKLIEKNNLLNVDAVESWLKGNRNVFFNLPGKFKTLDDNGVKITLMPLDADLSKHVIDHAKSLEMKLTGFLFAAAFYALKQLYEDNNFHFPRDVSCGIPANLRLRLEPNIDFSHTRYCVLLTHLDLFYPKFGRFQDIWEDAAYINECIATNTRFDNGSILEFSHDTEFIELGNAAFENITDTNALAFGLNSTKNFDLSLSNLGTHLYDRKKRVDGPLKLSEIYHGDSISTDPNAFCSLMLHIATWDGRIMIELSSSRKAIASHHVDQFMQLYQHVIEKSLVNSKIF